jgi:hypothetical protein
MALARASVGKRLRARQSCARLRATSGIGDFVASRGSGICEPLQLHKGGLEIGVTLLGQARCMQLTQNRGPAPLSSALIAPRAIFSPEVGGRKRNAADYDADKQIIKTHSEHPFAVRKNTWRSSKEG